VRIEAGPSLKLIGSEDMNDLQIGDNGSAFMPAGTSSLLQVRSLAFAPGAKLDLGDNDMLLDYNAASELANVQAAINYGAQQRQLGRPGHHLLVRRCQRGHNTTLGAMEASDYSRRQHVRRSALRTPPPCWSSTPTTAIPTSTDA
jgi:hypothetical protein